LFDNAIELLGYDLSSESISADRPLTLTLYWRARNATPNSTAYTAFAQLLAPDGHLVAQQDQPPAPPTTAWVDGQVIADPHAIRIVDPSYRGPATLIVGWYNSATIERLKTNDDEDHIALQTSIHITDK
jgi:hypothetical protein